MRMRPSIEDEADTPTTNLPHVGGRYAGLAEHLDDFVSGFEEYASFLMSLTRDPVQGHLLDGFAGLPVRKVVGQRSSTPCCSTVSKTIA